MNAGYIILDASGINLASGSAKTISGIQARAKKAMAINKPIFLSGMINGTDNPVTPVQAFASMSSTSVVLSFGVYTITITTADSCTVAQYSPTANKSK